MPFQYSTIIKKIDEIANEENKKVVYEFLEYMINNGSSENHQINNLKCMINFAKYLSKDVKFYDIKDKDQIISFLNTKRKLLSEDSDKKWIATWNNYLNRIRLFYRWFYNKDKKIESEYWETPDFLKIKLLKTKRLSPYSENELWEKEELVSIIKYESHKRNKAALALCWDLNARNHEVCLLRIKNIRLRENYGEGQIPAEAKTGSGPILLTMSFPYVRDWINEHLYSNEPEARLICDLNTGGKIRADALNDIMKLLRKRIIKLLENNEITDSKERQKLEYLIKTKKWNPYALRHSSICIDSDFLPEYALKKKCRWSMNSRQGSRYIKNRMGNELKTKILIQNGIISENHIEKKQLILNCPRCELSNALENKYCSKCSYPLKPEAYDDIKANEEVRIKKIEDKYENDMKKLKEEMYNQFNQIISMIQQNPILSQVKPEVLIEKK